MGRLTGHPNIVGVLQVGETERVPVPGHAVPPAGFAGGTDPSARSAALEEVLRLSVKMVGALDTAHRVGILHRDVKPANILLTDFSSRH